MDDRTFFEIPASTVPEPEPAQPPPASPPSPAAARAERPRRLWLLSALIGALVGAAVSGGIVAAVHDDGPSST